jgi:SAM-dependent methyltransferase
MNDSVNRLNAATFGAQAARYAAYRPGYPSELIAHLAALAPAHDLAWDCGTGNGQLALALATEFERVIATDASAEQIGLAPPHPRVEYRVVAAEDAESPRGRVALVGVAQAVHWFDLGRFYPRVQHALADGGVFVVIAYGDFDRSPVTEALRASGVIARIAPYQAPGNRLVWNGYRELPFPFDDIELPGFRLTVRWTLERYLGYVATWSAWQRYVDNHGDDLGASARAALAPIFGDGEQELKVTLAVRAGRKRA